ncbi:hypothetical protein, partial [uncultured Bilophila sp.]|uniref:hypothetical protein n=1 Tax=uncultured Bilophila sp. TaxID=529385 RepID=UPI0025E7F097
MSYLFGQSRFFAAQDHLGPLVLAAYLFRTPPFGAQGFKLFFFPFFRSHLFDFPEVHFQKFPAVGKITKTGAQGFFAFSGLPQAFHQNMAFLNQLGLSHPLVDQVRLKRRLKKFLLPMLAGVNKEGSAKLLYGLLRSEGVVDEQAA